MHITYYIILYNFVIYYKIIIICINFIIDIYVYAFFLQYLEFRH